MERTMDCKEFMRLIPDFLQKKLEYKTLKQFCEHGHDCKDCFEELNIQFLITEGMTRLEDGDAFDLNKELEKRLSEARGKIHRNETVLKAGMFVELFVMAVTAAAVLWILW